MVVTKVIRKIKSFFKIFKQKDSHNKNEDFYQLAELMLRIDEGVRKYPYKDTVGKISIGYGYNLTDRGLSSEIIKLLFDKDLENTKKEAELVFGAQFKEFTVFQQLGIINMIYNLGLPAFKGFKATIRNMKANKWQDAKASALKSKWAKQVKSRADRVTNLFLNKYEYFDL